MNDDWFEESVEEAFASPQARAVAEAIAKGREETIRRLRAEEAGQRANRRSPSEIQAAAREFASYPTFSTGGIIVNGASVPASVIPDPALTTNPAFPRAPRRPSSVRLGAATPPPSPGRTGAISTKLAIETLLEKVRNSDNPRAAAGELLAEITAEIIKVADEADPITD